MTLAILLLIGLLLFIAFLATRPESCPACDYRDWGAPVGRHQCPECGAEIDSDMRRWRYRRETHWREM